MEHLNELKLIEEVTLAAIQSFTKQKQLLQILELEFYLHFTGIEILEVS